MMELGRQKVSTDSDQNFVEMPPDNEKWKIAAVVQICNHILRNRNRLS